MAAIVCSLSLRGAEETINVPLSEGGLDGLITAVEEFASRGNAIITQHMDPKQKEEKEEPRQLLRVVSRKPRLVSSIILAYVIAEEGEEEPEPALCKPEKKKKRT